MAKINWQIVRDGYGPQFEVVASTRAQAIATAEAEWLKNTDYENELVGELDDDGVVITRSAIPAFKAEKLSRATSACLA